MYGLGCGLFLRVKKFRIAAPVLIALSIATAVYVEMTRSDLRVDPGVFGATLALLMRRRMHRWLRVAFAAAALATGALPAESSQVRGGPAPVVIVVQRSVERVALAPVRRVAAATPIVATRPPRVSLRRAQTTHAPSPPLSASSLRLFILHRALLR